jgi:beta-glucanase (GH16 family)
MIPYRHLQISTAAMCGVVFVGFMVARSNARVPAKQPAPAWSLVWSDEFDLPDNSRPDPSKWKFDLGGGGWGNDELEYYTNRPDNSFIRDGKLVIRAIKGDSSTHNARGYTSARIKTLGLFEQAYGRFEARIKIPRGRGVWPAFWLLGNDFGAIDWPACGEIDIMENIGKEPSAIHGSMHGPGYSHKHALTSIYKLPAGAFSDDFHIFAIEWDHGVVSFFVDQQRYARFTREQLPAGTKWVFDHPFFIILNLAIGGDWPGSPNSTTVFPQEMLVDYVRVYKRAQVQ